MTFDEWKEKQGFPVTSTQEPLWRACWMTALEEAARLCRKTADGLMDDMAVGAIECQFAVESAVREMRGEK